MASVLNFSRPHDRLSSARDTRSAFVLSCASLLILVLFAFPAHALLPNCSVSALTSLGIPNMTITSATDVPAAAGIPEFCDILGRVATDGEGAGPSSSAFRIDLPDNWNQKFVFNGGGGFDGSTSRGSALELTKGYATASTDSGHPSSVGSTFAFTSPGLPNEPQLVDYFYRSRHQVGIAAKRLVLAYYKAKGIARSYFTGCSNGGKEGLMNAMRYPDDYDGIVSGAPWMDPLGTELWVLKNVKALVNAWIPPSAYPVIDAAVMAQCDAADGVVDGLIQNPAVCSFNPDSLVPATLTQAQADALKLIIRPVVQDDGAFIYPGSPVSGLGTSVGSEERPTPPTDPTGAQPWGTLSAGPGNWNLSFGMIVNLGLYGQPVNLMTGVVETNGIFRDSALDVLYTNLAPNIVDQPSRLRKFLAKGHKLILWHGYNDSIITPYKTVQFYEALAAQGGGYRETQEKVRLFMLPNTQHCGGGPGPNTFDSLTAIENWVEQGVAPESLVASHSTSGVVDRTMPLCRFPEKARYVGGNVNDAASWTCGSRDRSLLKVGKNGRQAGLRGGDDDDRDDDDRDDRH
jgi:feruloyl esterase